MKKFIALLLVFLLITLPGFITAKERRGTELIVYKKDGSRVKGELITIKKDSLLLLSNAGRDESIDVNDIDIIKIVKRSKALFGAGIGLATGAVIGAVAVSSSKTEKNEPYGLMYNISKETGERFVVIGAIGLAILATLIGAGLGATAGVDKTIHIEGKSEAEIQKIMEDLRSKARIRDFQ